MKRGLADPGPEPKAKRARTYPHLEVIPDEIQCNQLPVPDKVPRIMFSQIDNIEGLQRCVT